MPFVQSAIAAVFATDEPVLEENRRLLEEEVGVAIVGPSEPARLRRLLEEVAPTVPVSIEQELLTLWRQDPEVGSSLGELVLSRGNIHTFVSAERAFAETLFVVAIHPPRWAGRPGREAAWSEIGEAARALAGTPTSWSEPVRELEGMVHLLDMLRRAVARTSSSPPSSAVETDPGARARDREDLPSALEGKSEEERTQFFRDFGIEPVAPAQALKRHREAVLAAAARRDAFLEGCFETKEVEGILGVKRERIRRRVEEGSLLAILDRGRYRFPPWQFDVTQADRVVRGLADVLQVLPGTAYSKALWLDRPHEALNADLASGEDEGLEEGLESPEAATHGAIRPIEALRRGHLEEVLAAAQLETV